METGRQVWRANSGSSQPPAVSAEVVVVSARDGGVYGLDAATGEQRWLFPTGRDSLTAPVVANDVVVVGAGSSLMGLDIATGETLWYFLAGDIIESPSIVSDGHVFFGGRDGFLYALRVRESVDGG
jgi:glucose dehydrogenase